VPRMGRGVSPHPGACLGMGWISLELRFLCCELMFHLRR
jgi:hypothetical protein